MQNNEPAKTRCLSENESRRQRYKSPAQPDTKRRILKTNNAKFNELTALLSPLLAIDDFEKIKIIGKGGFAEKVYLARKKDNG